ncbi:MAG: aminotransferase class III-fold pyridoxal phosphate-dependent enzyme, partial [Nitrospirota bacterium]|nr:aminotransferase class III-fold pyridoxal phosphate-dependent enzyme [Nitrospirota bacterium]
MGHPIGDGTATVTDVSVTPAVPVRRESESLWRRAENVIPCGTQTLSKGPDQFVRGVYPIYLQRGEGCHVWDVDGNEYIDYPMALGPILLGYQYPTVHEAVVRQLGEGTTFTLMHPKEVELAEALVECIPCAEMVRFAKNGSDVTAAAVRAARAYTSREQVAFCGYHGWQDWYAVTTSRPAGVPTMLKGLAHAFEFNKTETLERIFLDHPGDIAAVILEVGGENPHPGFLEQVKALAHRHGAVFIWDEIVTGFRLALGGAQEYYGVTPDLACFGKGMANGFPLSAVVGRRDLMKTFERVFFSMTYGGETLSLAAALATLQVLRTEPVIAHLWAQGAKFRDGVAAAAAAAGVPVKLIGQPPRSALIFSDRSGEESTLVKSLFMQECVK